MKIRVPRIGEQRTRSKFLFTPVSIEGIIRWLEFASWVEEYKQDGWDQIWVPIRWIDY